MAMSATGQYMYGVQYGQSYYIYISRNYGQSWEFYAMPGGTIYLPQSIA
jgi:hypothetical protein